MFGGLKMFALMCFDKSKSTTPPFPMENTKIHQKTQK